MRLMGSISGIGGRPNDMHVATIHPHFNNNTVLFYFLICILGILLLFFCTPIPKHYAAKNKNIV